MVEGLRWNVVLFSYSSGGSLCGADPITISGQTATPETPSKDSEILVHKSRHLSLFHLRDTFSIRPVNVSSVYMISIRIHSQILSKGDWFSDLLFQFKFQDPSEFLATGLPLPRSLKSNVLCVASPIINNSATCVFFGKWTLSLPTEPYSQIWFQTQSFKNVKDLEMFNPLQMLCQ